MVSILYKLVTFIFFSHSISLFCAICSFIRTIPYGYVSSTGLILYDAIVWCRTSVWREYLKNSVHSFYFDSFMTFLVVLCWKISIKGRMDSIQLKFHEIYACVIFRFFFWFFIACESNLSTWNPVWKCLFLVASTTDGSITRCFLLTRWSDTKRLAYVITSCVAKTIYPVRNHLMNDDLTMRFAYYKAIIYIIHRNLPTHFRARAHSFLVGCCECFAI